MSSGTDEAQLVEDELLTFDEINLALTRCMEAHPPAGLDFQMDPDANTIASLWGLMLYERAASVALSQVSQPVLEAYRRWSSPAQP